VLGKALQERLRDFVAARDWSQFHDPKNLVMALASEVGELTAEYRWVSNAEADALSGSEPARGRITAEIGDIGILLVLLCERIQIDLAGAIEVKLRANEAHYPVDLSRGRPSRPETPPSK
jgi:NTP pyrophosphatase (non-canonical NTP hydrolase)